VDYVQKSEPLVIENLAKIWPAYIKWQNSSYLKQKSGDEWISVERAPRDSNKFAFYLENYSK